jgi:hypothetical protein
MVVVQRHKNRREVAFPISKGGSKSFLSKSKSAYVTITITFLPPSLSPRPMSRSPPTFTTLPAAITGPKVEETETQESDGPDSEAGTESFATAKHCICLGIGLVFFFAFLAAHDQNPALLGSEGLVPFRPHIERQQAQFDGDWWRGFFTCPSLWYNFSCPPFVLKGVALATKAHLFFKHRWFLDPSDANLEGIALVGMAISALIVVGGHYSACFAGCWLCYFSIVSAGEGSAFYSYGWESQLLETSFLAVFLCSPFDRQVLVLLMIRLRLCEERCFTALSLSPSLSLSLSLPPSRATTSRLQRGPCCICLGGSALGFR